MGAQLLIIKKFGEPGAAYQEQHCELWEVQKDFPWFPAKKLLINKEFKNKLFAAFTNLQKAGIQGEIKTFDGCYNDRSVRGRASQSLHAWAMAIDINAATEKLAQNSTHFTGQFLAIMKAAGLFWGGDWKSRKDSMHFALFNG